MDESGPVVVLQPVGQAMDERSYGQGFDIESNQEARHRFREFFRNFRQGNLYTYREALVCQFNRQDYFIEVDLAHVNEYDEKLFNNLQSKPDKIMPYFEYGAKDALQMFLTSTNSENVMSNKVPDFQVILKSSQLPHSLRSLRADLMNKLVKVSDAIDISGCEGNLSWFPTQLSLADMRLTHIFPFSLFPSHSL